MAPLKWFTAVVAGSLASTALAAPTATTDTSKQLVKRASINDVGFMPVHE